MWIRVFPNQYMNINSKNCRKRSFSYKPKHQYRLPQWGECVCGTQSWKEGRLLYEFMFIPNERQTSILKMVEREVFLMKAKHQYHLT